MLAHALPTGSREDEARISIDGVRVPVVARIDRRMPGGVTLRRELPLLRVGTPVRDEAGRPGRIEGVWIAMDGETPSLCVEVAYDVAPPRSGRPPAVRGDATLGYEELAALAAGRGSGKRVRRPRTDDTNRHATLGYAGEDADVSLEGEAGAAAEERPPVALDTIPPRASAPVIIRRSVWDRVLDVLDAAVDRVRAFLRDVARRPLASR